MKKLVVGIFILIAMLVAAIVVLPSLVPAETYKDKLEAQLANALNRDVTISGDIELSVFPVIKAKTGAIQIDNADGFTDQYFITMDELDARIKLLPLLSKKVEVAKFELTRPIINLETNANGKSNWVIGETAAPTSEAAEKAPFKRDGRYNDYNPNIGSFAITDGQISFRDAISGDEYDIQGAGLSFSLPSLDEIVNVKGEMILNGTAVDLDVSLDTPRYFLSGGLTNFAVKLETEFLRVKGDGQFAESEELDFNARLDGDVSDMKALLGVLPREFPYSDLVNQAGFSGDFTYSGDTVVAKNSALSANGNLFDAQFDGDATLNFDSDIAPIVAGRVSADVKDIPALATVFEKKINGIELAKTASLSADLTAQESGFLAKNIIANVSGDKLNGTYRGQADFSDKVTAQGAFTASAQDLPNIVKALKLEIEQDIIVNTLDVSGQINYSQEAINVTLDKADVQGENLTASYTGDVNVRGKDITAKGAFTADAKAIPALLTALKIDAPQATILDQASTSGRVDYSKDAISLALNDTNLNSADLVAAYAGDVRVVGKAVSTTGVLSTLDIPSVPTLGQKLKLTSKATKAFGQVKINQPLSIDYDGTTARLSNVAVSLLGGDFNGSFTGNVTQSLGDNPNTALNGNFSGETASLRRVAQHFDVKLPASTSQGSVFERFVTSGNIQGDLNNLNLTLSSLTLDALQGSGNFTVNMSGSRPNVNGKLTIQKLDARPYQAAYAPPPNAPKPEGWSKTPLDVSGVRKFDADVTLSTSQLLTSSVSFGQSDIQAKVLNGLLTVNFPNMSLYGGQGQMNMSVDASRANPVLDMDLNLSSLDTESVLAKFVKFASATGAGGTNFKVRGAGLSMDSIMKSLTGGGEFGVREGLVRGIDLQSTLSGFSSGLNLQSAVSGVGPTKVTQFNDLVGQFSMNNGVMTINDFDFDAVGVAATGGGFIDIGNRTVDFRFKPRLTTANANSFARAGIPLRISGTFSSVKTGLDQDAVGSLLAAQAQSLIKDQISNQVGGSAGAILGSVLGGNNGSSSAQSGSSQTQSQSVESVLGGILGGNRSTSSGTSSQSTETKKSDEEQVEDIARDVLGGLFGSKKKKSNDDD
ncbi:MAG: AsmA family protein [Maricaulaceae bacterium]